MSFAAAPVSFASVPKGPPGSLTNLAVGYSGAGVIESLALAKQLGSSGKCPGAGDTRDIWEALATVGARDLGAARAVEPHLDALAILDQATNAGFEGQPDATERAWGVFAAEGGSDPLIASAINSGWRLDGTKPWCSLAGELDSALITASVDGGSRRLFAVDLSDPGVDVRTDSWHSRGLAEIRSGPVHFASVSAVPVGDEGWYLERPGFAWGGIGVAACWFGGAVGLARSLFSAAQKSSASPFLFMHLGAVDELLQSCRRALLEASQSLDDGVAVGSAGRLLAKRVRSTVARSSEEVIQRVGHALGPAPLALDEGHSKRVSDLELYLRQHHAERDDASLGEALARAEGAPW
ncbi:acyl-CoA dehydrogenase [Glaciihabitans sp. UYNi722]|uniref:acyl-CoA dehydrogenase n=1 Tax=Glaciihabitans sp. UYNi722 TaxID=3156344 RepID=UPI0033916DB9